MKSFVSDAISRVGPREAKYRPPYRVTHRRTRTLSRYLRV